MKSKSRLAIKYAAAAAYAIAALVPNWACDGVESNYSTNWWKKPTRIVRPDRSKVPPSAEQANSGQAASEPATAAREPAANSEGSGPAASRPYYQVYLVVGSANDKARAGSSVRIRGGNARTVGRLLEWLYLPLGRSGSDTETYLIYEQREEFESAMQVAPLLDMQPTDDPAHATGGAAFDTGVSQVLRLIDEGAIVSEDLLEAATTNLSAAAASAGLAPRQRWVAGIVAGRLRSEYLYDHAGARQLYERAASAMPPESIEAMTAMWWMADALHQEGKRREAAETCEELLDEFVHLWPNSYIITRCSAMLKKLRP